MKLEFVSHSSMIVTTEDSVIWSDPWLFGKAFNDSWSLFPDAHFRNENFNLINYIWISHEHPDHFHIPTLKSLPDFFKATVTVLFQKNNSNKVSDALRKFGYKNIVLLPHQKFVKITPKTTVWNYQVGQMDSVLGIISPEKVLLNLNDAEINVYDSKIIKKTLGNIDVLLNQYSIAGYNGYADYQKHLPSDAKSILDKVYDCHTA
ncbi:MAG: MBL fold metallo-hydrolase, partial [Legionellaceae bacterium]|nr:MBL fold metallo-hydrolase [Legionellaceae bacterium]